jgi:Bacterial TSP3 repeat/Alpha/beta hydrolase of unknown function (DUF900)
LTNAQEYHAHLSPIYRDTDGDGVDDGLEVNVYHTNPLLADSDGDGIADGWEVQYGLNPLSKDGFNDSDGDGLSDEAEFLYHTDPHNPDSDGDGVPDGQDGWANDPTFSPPRLPDLHYAVIDLGPGEATALNNQSDVVGFIRGPSFPEGFAWTQGARISLGPYSMKDINDEGQMIASEGYYWSDLRGGAQLLTMPIDLSDYPNPNGHYGSWYVRWPSKINNGGFIVARRVDDSHNQWNDTFISVFGRNGSFASEKGAGLESVNDSGIFTGMDDAGFAVMVEAGFIIEHLGSLPTPFNSGSDGIAINDGDDNNESEVAGWSYHAYPFQFRACLWTRGRVIDLGELAGCHDTYASAINNNRQIGGGGGVYPGDKAFLWQNQGIRDLNDWISPDSGVHLYWASDINDNGVIAASGYNAQGLVHAYLLVPTEIMVDANRDGQMSFTNAAIHSGDTTTSERPYRFWLNDDDDGAADEQDHIPVSTPDYADGIIRSRRDLEDFARLHVNLGALHEGLESGAIKAAFEWRDTSGAQGSGSPKIKLYRAVTEGTEYLTDDAKAVSSTISPFRDTLGEVIPGIPLFMPDSFWTRHSPFANVPKTLPTAWFLFEGSGEGKGRLVISFWKDNQRIGETLGAWLELKNIKKMYQREDISGKNQWSPVSFEPDSKEKQQAIVFVHGWNVSPEGASITSETMYKRLWHRGFSGRFVAVRWDTYWSSNFDHVPGVGQTLDAYLAKFNDSEHNAWLSGQAVKGLVANLPANYSKNFIAHSMGNVVVGSALRYGMVLDNYVLLHGAVPASCYDTADRLEQMPALGAFGYTYWNSKTPDDDVDSVTRFLAYRGRISNASGNLVNFYLPEDSALTYAWEFNNRVFKPQAGFGYDREAEDGSKLWKIESLIRRVLTDPDEAMPYADRSWSKVVGAESRTAGLISRRTNLASEDFSVPGDTDGFKNDHSAEFNRRLQQGLTAFYNRLLREFNIPFNP